MSGIEITPVGWYKYFVEPSDIQRLYTKPLDPRKTTVIELKGGLEVEIEESVETIQARIKAQ